MKRLRRIGAGMWLGVVVVGCGSAGKSSSAQVTASPSSVAGASVTSQASGTGGGPDPCQLVTAADASAAVGGPVGPGKPLTSKLGSRSCTYTEQPTAVDSGLVTVTVLTKDVTFAAIKSQYTDVQPLAGAGDEAFIAFKADTAGGNAVVRKGSRLVAISLGAKGPTSAIPDKLAVLARMAAGHL